jgi:hypothetical protein
VADSKPHRDIMINLSNLEQEIKDLLGEYKIYLKTNR